LTVGKKITWRKFFMTRRNPKRITQNSKPFYSGMMGKLIGILLIVILFAVAYGVVTNGVNFNFGGTGGGTTIISNDKPATGTSVWDYRGDTTKLKPPDVNLYLYDATFYEGQTLTSPTGDGLNIYIFAEQPLTMVPSNTDLYSDIDRLQKLIDEHRYIQSYTAVSWNANGLEIIDDDALKTWITGGEISRYFYILVWDSDYTEGTVSTSQPDNWPLVIKVDIGAMSNGNYLVTTEEDFNIQIGGGATKNAVAVWPAQASNGVMPVGAVTTGTSSATTAYVRIPTTCTNDSGFYYWQPDSVGGSIDMYGYAYANSTTQTFSYVQINNVTTPSDTATIGGYEYVFFKVPRGEGKEGNTFNVDIYYGNDENTTYLTMYMVVGEWESMGKSQNYASSLARIRQVLASAESTKADSVFC